MRVGLYFGSFNPVHLGHIAVARFFAQCGELDELRLIVSPQNPLKADSLSSNATDRLVALERALERHKIDCIVSDIEYNLPKPLYTINTLRFLREREPSNSFILIVGADILSQIELWHDWKILLSEFEVWVYPRTGYDGESLCNKYGTIFKQAPLVDISSTQIREGEELGLDMSNLKA
jgi:nicotinate-nucleotide adenylyltransferase